MNKKKTAIKTTLSKKPKVIKKVITKKAVKNKKVVNKVSVAKKRTAFKKDLKSFKPFRVFIISSVFIAVIATLLVVGSKIALQNDASSDSVLSANSTSNNTYSVSEDDLLMFATLAYETPSVVVPQQNPFHPNDPDSKIFTHYNPDSTPTQLFTRCPVMVTNFTVSNPVDDTQKKCLTMEETPKEYDNKSDYMYKKEHIVGADYEAKLKKENINSVSDIPLRFAQWAFVAMLGKNPGEEYYFSGLANLEAANSEFGNLRGWDAVEYFESPTQGDGNDYGLISAVTFKKGHDIVIAYRGTDLTDAVDWIGIDGSYALKNNTKQDILAKQYALRIGKIYNEGNKGEQYRIYTTGHSLGGYLAQIGASGLLELQNNNTVSNPYNLTRVVYFNGMGLFFSSKSIVNSSNGQIATRDKLVAFNTSPSGEKDDKLLFVHMFGDVVSSLGIHYGAYKEMHVSKNAMQSQNIFYVLSLGTLFDNYCGLYKVNNFCSTLRDSDRYKNFLSSRSNIINGLGKIMSFIKINFNTTQIAKSLEEQVALGAPYNGVLAYIMTTHKTNSFFYTKYYEDMVKNYGKGYKYGANNVDTVADSPQLANIAAADGLIDDSITWGRYGTPLCTFNSNYSSTHTVTFPLKPGQIFEAEYLKLDKELTGRIVCHSKYGFKDIEISRASDIFYRDDYPIMSLNIASVGIQNTIGKQLISGDPTTYYWDVKITPQRQSLNRKKLRLGKVTDLFLKSGAVIANNDVANENIPYNHIIQTTNDNTPSPIYIAETQPIVVNPGTITNDTKPRCSIILPSKIIAKIWPFYQYYSGTISCISDIPMIDRSISVGNIASSPSGRLIIDSVSGFNYTYSSKKYYYRWSVKFRGARSNTGNANIILVNRSISTANWSNPIISSNSVTVSK